MKIAVTGHRPQSLSSPPCWSPSHPLRVTLRRGLKETLHELVIPLADHVCWSDHVAITGMALGVDQDFARVALDLGMKVCAALPCHGQDSRWPDSSKREYISLLEEIEKTGGLVHVVTPTSYTSRCMQDRNEAMVDAADHLIVVWSGAPGGTLNCLIYAMQKWFSSYPPVPVHFPDIASRITRINPTTLASKE